MESVEFNKAIEELNQKIGVKSEKPGHFYQALIHKLQSDNSKSPETQEMINEWFMIGMVENTKCIMNHLS